MRSSRLLLALAATTFLAGRAATAQDTTVSKGEVARVPSFSSLVSAVNLTSTTLATLKSHAAIKPSELKLVNATPLVEGQDETVLKSAIEKNAAAIEELRAWLGAQPIVTELLTQQKLTAADVIAVSPHMDGTIDIYFRAKKE